MHQHWSLSFAECSCWKSNNERFKCTEQQKKIVIFSFFVLLSSLSLRVFLLPFVFVHRRFSLCVFFLRKRRKHIDCMINSSHFRRMKKISSDLLFHSGFFLLYSLARRRCIAFAFFFYVLQLHILHQNSRLFHRKMKSCVDTAMHAWHMRMHY